MGEAPHGTSSTARHYEDRLDSWKEIAAYLKRDVTTVQRWEKREGMPVHRHLHDRMGSVYASRTELDTWSRSRKPAIPENGSEPASPSTSVQTPAANAERPWWKRAILPVAVLAAAALALGLWLQHMEFFWKNPIAGGQFVPVTDFDGVAEAAAISRDGRLIAFLSDRDGPVDVWVTQAGSGEYHNLTHGSFPGLANPAVRTLNFTPDAALVTFWLRKPDSKETGTWAVPTLGGQPRSYLDGAAEFDWSRDGSRLAYHTSAPGDPLSISKDAQLSDARLIATAASGQHAHFPLLSGDGSFVYFVQGTLPDKLDIWRIRSTGGTAERITSHDARVMYPVLLQNSTLLYLATDGDGSGPWIYSVDVNRRVSHRLTSGPERYTSLAASADGRHLVMTVASAKKTLWRQKLGDSAGTAPAPIPLSTGTGFAPRLRPDYLLYISTAGAQQSIWKFANGTGTQLWHAAGAHFLAAPAISPDGRWIAFAVRQGGHSLLNLMQADGTNAHVLSDALDIEGEAAWSPDGRYVTVAVKDGGTPHLVQVPVNGHSHQVLVADYSMDPAWSPDGRFILYSGPDIGTRFAVKLFPVIGSSPPWPSLTLTRGGRHLAFLHNGKTVVFLQGVIEHKDLWQMDLQTGEKHLLTNLPADFNVSDFDVSPDGSEIVLERTQERSEVTMLNLP